MTSVTLKGIAKSFGAQEVIRGIDIEIPDKSFTVLVGPSGCGKSTLLRLIAGLEEPSSGDILIGGERVNDLAPAARGLAMVFQSYALYPHMTAFENMAFGLRRLGRPRAEIEARVHEAARILEIEPLLARRPRALSGGQRQRVAIGRAIVRKPRAFLFDEPLSNLDAALRGQMRMELAALRKRLDATMIYVTHDQIEAMTLADRIVLLNEGRVEQAGAPLDLYRQPRNLFVASFLGSPGMNFLEAEIEKAEGDSVMLRISDRTLNLRMKSGDLAPGTRLTLGIRPDEIVLGAPESAAFKGEVTLVEQLGSDTHLQIRLARMGEPIIARTDGSVAIKAGDIVSLDLPGERCHLFDETGTAMVKPGTG